LGKTSIGETKISTCWLGQDHNCGQGALAIFETMFFEPDVCSVFSRYATEQEALEGHERAVQMFKAKMSP
jgi:hypothetical protein